MSFESVFRPSVPARLLGVLFIAVVCAFSAGCGSTKLSAKLGKEGATAEKEPPPPPPPPAKKCESLAEKCEGGKGTRIPIVSSGQSFEPVSGWAYAAESEATIAQLGDSGPAFAALGYEGGDPKTDAATRDAALETLIGKIGVAVKSKKLRWNKPLEESDIGKLKVSMWQLEGANRGDKRGPLLVFAAPLTDGKALLGIAFVPDDDETSADANMLCGMSERVSPLVSGLMSMDTTDPPATTAASPWNDSWIQVAKSLNG